MKKATLSRILGLALALVLALSTSVAFAMPSGTSAIEGLPDMPTVPTMTTAAKDTEHTITLSEPLAWLNVVENWNWMDIIKWSDDKLVGTYSTKGLAAQPGYGTWSSNVKWFAHTQERSEDNPWGAHWDGKDTPMKNPDYSGWDDLTGLDYYTNGEWDETRTAAEVGEDYVWEDWDHSAKTEPYGAHDEGLQVHREYAYGAGFYVEYPVDIWRIAPEDGGDGLYHTVHKEEYIPFESDDEEALMEKWFELEEKVDEYRDALAEKYIKLEDWDAVAYIYANIDAGDRYPIWSQIYDDVCGVVDYFEDGIVREYNKIYYQSFGVYELDDDFAYDGATNDGTLVRYGRYGELVRVGVTLTGVNFLNTGKDPVKTTVYWRPLEHKGKNVSNFYIFQITEEYEDGSKLNAHFSSSMGGKYLGSKPE